MARSVVVVVATALLLVLLLISSVDCGSTLTYLPGFHGPLPFHLQTGYVGVGESEDVQLFYYFVESETNPKKDPLLLWLTGGPACSAWSGLVYEIGPLNYRLQAYNGSLPTLILNDYSWTKVSSIIFVDSPVGAGFSYGKTPSASKASDHKQVRELAQFFNKWLIDHPEFVSNPVYIAGDSYSGKIIPVLLQQLSKEIEEGVFVPINLQGYIIGNPVTFPYEKNYRIQFAHGMALISDELYESLERSCRGNYFVDVDPNNTECLKNIKAYKETISGIRKGNILDAKCNFESPKPHDLSTTRRRRWLNQNPQRPINCREFDELLSGYWANDPDVRNALHIRKGSKKIWQRCNSNVRDNLYRYEISSTIEYHANLSAKGFRSLLYSGDHDMVVPFMSTQAWIRSLNYSIVDDWRSWVVQGQVAGYTRSYSNRMTFATVKGGGHTAPQYKPKECFAMFQRWVHHQSL